MDIDERLQTILQECRWVRDSGTAAQLVPALASEAPAFVPLPQRDGEVRPAVPVVCLEMVASAVVKVIVDAADGKAGGFENLDAAGVAADPLAAALADMFEQVSHPGLRAQLTPVLVTTWAAWQVLAGRADTLPGVDANVAQASRTAAARIAAASGTAKADLLQNIGWALTSRVAGALHLAGMAGADVATGGLYRQILPNPLMLAFPRGTLDVDPAPAAGILGLSLEPGLIHAGSVAAAQLLVESRARLEKGQEEPLDVALQAVIPAEVDAETASLHPIAGPALIAALPVLMDAKAMGKLKIDKKYVKGLASAKGARALTAAWKRLCHGLGGWDVLSSLVARVVPLTEREGRMVGPGGALPADARWPMLVPRANALNTVQAVVAIRCTESRESLLGVLSARPWSIRNLERSFVEAARKNGASVRQFLGDVAVCTFPAPELALRFALVVRRVLGAESPLELGEDSTAMSVPASASIGIGMALGVVTGGTDGEAAVLGGRAVSEAVALAGNGRAVNLYDDGVGVRAAGWSAEGLSNEGIVASQALVRSLVDRTKRRNRPVHVRGEGGLCGGVSEDFAVAPVTAWWEAGEGIVAAALMVDAESSEGIAEIRVLSQDDLKEWFGSDRSAAALRTSRRPAPAATEHSSGGDDDFARPSMSFMGFDDGPKEAPAAAPPSRSSSFGFAAPPVSAPESSVDASSGGFNFIMDDEEEAAPASDFSMARGPARSGRAEPAPPMMMDEPSPRLGFASSPPVSAPMMLDDEPSGQSDGLGFGDASLQPASAGRSQLMMMEDDAPSGPSAPMMLDDDPFDSGSDAEEGLAPADSVFGPPTGRDASAMSMLHSTYQGEMELVGVAGFSLAGGETAAGADPFHDPNDETGFYDERYASQPPAAAPAPSRPPDGAMVRELVRLLRGYVVVHDGRRHTFGLPDGAVLRDAWSHEGDVHGAYVGFLRGKVADGFIPRADRVVSIGKGVRPSPIDSAEIERAAGEAGL